MQPRKDSASPKLPLGAELAPPPGVPNALLLRAGRTLSLPRMQPERLVQRQSTQPEETSDALGAKSMHTPGGGAGEARGEPLLPCPGHGLQASATDPGPSSGGEAH